MAAARRHETAAGARPRPRQLPMPPQPQLTQAPAPAMPPSRLLQDQVATVAAALLLPAAQLGWLVFVCCPSTCPRTAAASQWTRYITSRLQPAHGAACKSRRQQLSRDASWPGSCFTPSSWSLPLACRVGGWLWAWDVRTCSAWLCSVEFVLCLMLMHTMGCWSVASLLCSCWFSEAHPYDNCRDCLQCCSPPAGMLRLLGEAGVPAPPLSQLAVMDPRLLCWLLEPHLLQVGWVCERARQVLRLRSAGHGGSVILKP